MHSFYFGVVLLNNAVSKRMHTYSHESTAEYVCSACGWGFSSSSYWFHRPQTHGIKQSSWRKMDERDHVHVLCMYTISYPTSGSGTRNNVVLPRPICHEAEGRMAHIWDTDALHYSVSHEHKWDNEFICKQT